MRLPHGLDSDLNLKADGAMVKTFFGLPFLRIGKLAGRASELD